MEISLPHKFKPRPYQIPLLKAIDNGIKRAVAVWHRRAGKDKTLINLMVKKSFERVGCYYYYFPTLSQGRKILWDGIDRDGFKFTDHVPKELIANKNDQEMKFKMVNDSIVQIVGTDRAEVVGPNPVGCVFSEYSLQNPTAWNFVRPILAENSGWSVFNFTPRGMNHGHTIYQMALDNPSWFCELLTVEDTAAIPMEAVEDERRAGMSEELIKQEFYCSFEYGLEGAYYLKQLAVARKEGRITKVPVEQTLVHTAWDLGIGDATAIWFFQLNGRNVSLIDYYEQSGEGIAHYAKVLKDKGYMYGEHYAPHDIEVRELGTGQSRRARAREMGINFNVVPNMPIDDGIEAVRGNFIRFWFNQETCQEGLNALMNYQKEWNEKHQVFNLRPLHNWASHGADALRYLSIIINNVSVGGAMTAAKAEAMYRQYGPPGVR